MPSPTRARPEAPAGPCAPVRPRPSRGRWQPPAVFRRPHRGRQAGALARSARRPEPAPRPGPPTAPAVAWDSPGSRAPGTPRLRLLGLGCLPGPWGRRRFGGRGRAVLCLGDPGAGPGGLGQPGWGAGGGGKRASQADATCGGDEGVGLGGLPGPHPVDLHVVGGAGPQAGQADGARGAGHAQLPAGPFGRRLRLPAQHHALEVAAEPIEGHEQRAVGGAAQHLGLGVARARHAVDAFGREAVDAQVRAARPGPGVGAGGGRGGRRGGAGGRAAPLQVVVDAARRRRVGLVGPQREAARPQVALQVLRGAAEAPQLGRQVAPRPGGRGPRLLPPRLRGPRGARGRGGPGPRGRGGGPHLRVAVVAGCCRGRKGKRGAVSGTPPRPPPALPCPSRRSRAEADPGPQPHLERARERS